MESTTFPEYYYITSNYTEDNTEVIDPNIYLMIQICNILFFSITFILGIPGNALVIWIAGFKMQKTVTILWFLNLAIADFAFDMFLPLQITEMIMKEHWPFGQTMCKIIFTVLFLNMFVSTSFLMIISIDRCTSIMCPVWSKNHRTPRLALIISAIIWLICFLLSAPYLAFLNIVHDSENNISYCIPLYADDDETDTMRDQSMIIVRFASTFLIPFPVMVICYSLIVYRLRRSRSLSRSKRPLKVIITIVLCFFSLWLPYNIWYLLNVPNIEINHTVDFIMYNLGYGISCFNTCVNPIIYVFAGRDFKKILFRSIPFLLEKTFKEKDGSNTNTQTSRRNQTVMETEMESYDV